MSFRNQAQAKRARLYLVMHSKRLKERLADLEKKKAEIKARAEDQVRLMKQAPKFYNLKSAALIAAGAAGFALLLKREDDLAAVLP